MAATIILVLFYLIAPAGVLWLCGKSKLFKLIGPVLTLYILGIVVGNLSVLPQSAPQVQDILSSAIVPVAIPMMLFGCDFRRFDARRSLLTLVCGIFAVALAVVAGFVLFGDKLIGDAPNKIGGMLVGVYTGGTPNLAALKMMLGVSDETFIIMNSYDMLVSFLYLVFVLGVGIRWFRKLLPYNSKLQTEGETVDDGQFNAHPYRGFFKHDSLVQVLKALGWSLLILVVSGGAALAVNRLVGNDNYFMTVLILMLTTLGIVASFMNPVRKLQKSFDAGMYLVYIFSLVVASMADLSRLDFHGGIFLLLYLLLVVFGSLVVQIILARLLHIDADTVVISSVSLINSPPFVPMVATAMNNRNIIITGLGVGLVGYAAGNYLGFLVCRLLELL